MKSIGIVRKIDELGRIVLPKELRSSNSIYPGDDFEIYVEENKIILEKYGKCLSKSEKVKSIFNNEKILFIINDIIVNNGNKILPSFNKIIHERKCVTIKDICELSKNMELNTGAFIYPIVIDSNIIGTLVFPDGIKTNELSKIIIKIINIL